MRQFAHIIPGDDDETTLEAPRFDVRAERAAQPVVPLANGTGEEPSAPRPWPLAFVLLFSLLGGLAGFAALGLSQRRTPPSAPSAISPDPAPPSSTVAKEKAMIIAPPAKPLESNGSAPAPDRVEAGAGKERPKTSVEERAEAAPARRPTGEPVSRPSREEQTAAVSRPERSTAPQEVRNHHDSPKKTQDRPADESAATTTTEGSRPVDRVRDIFEGRRTRPREVSRRSVDRVREIFEGSRPR